MSFLFSLVNSLYVTAVWELYMYVTTVWERKRTKVTTLATVQWKDRLLSNCTTDDRSLAFYVIKTSD